MSDRNPPNAQAIARPAGGDGDLYSAKRQRKVVTSWPAVLLIIGLSILSWISTYTGMLELITANAGEISLIYMIAVGFAVAVLQLMILYVLDALFSKRFYYREFGKFNWGSIPLSTLYLIGYILLSVISIGFGFGFYWKFLEARTETTASAQSSIAQVQNALQVGQSRLEQLQTTFVTLAEISAEKAEIERTVGRTCPGSPPGDGPRRRLRDADAQRFSFANRFVGQKVDAVKADVSRLNAELAKVLGNDPSTIDPATGTRNVYMRGVNRQLGLTATRFNALRTDPQLRQIRDEFAERAQQTVFPRDNGGTFSCPDAELQTALNGVVRAIDNLPQMRAPEVVTVEGSEAVIEAFRRLTTSLFGLVRWERPPSPDELRDTQGLAARTDQNGAAAAAVQPGLGTRDYIPLAIAIFVDFCILLVSVNRPLRGPFDRLSNKVEEAQGAEMNKFMSIFYQAFEDQFGRYPKPLEVFAPLHDVVFDHKGEYYAAVPLKFKDSFNGEEDVMDQSPVSGDPMKHSLSRYIANVLVALEGEGFVQLDYSLKHEQVVDKLKKAGSRYADAEAFRVYKFRKGAWPDIVTRSVVSAHRQEAIRVKSGHVRDGEFQARIDRAEIDRGPLKSPDDKARKTPEPVADRRAGGRQIPAADKDKPREGAQADPDADSYSPIDPMLKRQEGKDGKKAAAKPSPDSQDGKETAEAKEASARSAEAEDKPKRKDEPKRSWWRRALPSFGRDRRRAETEA